MQFVCGEGEVCLQMQACVEAPAMQMQVLPPFEDFGGNLQCFLELVQALPGFTVVVHPVGIRPWFEEEVELGRIPSVP